MATGLSSSGRCGSATESVLRPISANDLAWTERRRGAGLRRGPVRLEVPWMHHSGDAAGGGVKPMLRR